MIASYVCEYIIWMAKQGETTDSIYTAVDVSKSCIYEILNKANLVAESNYRRKQRFLREDVQRLRAEKKTYAEISKALGMKLVNVQNMCSDLGLTYSEDEARDYLVKRSNASQIAEKLKDLNIGLEYVEGYTAKNKPMKVRKLSCGHIFEIQWHSLSQNRAKWAECPCPVCTEKVQSEKREAAKAATKMRQAQYVRNCVVCGKTLDGPLSITRRYCSDVCAAKARIMKQTEKYESGFVSVERICNNCGKAFMTHFKGRKSYCSDECAAMYEQVRKREQASRRLKNKIVDKGITLARVYNRDGGICQICGKACGWDDYRRDANNYFVIGKTYPTIDHIKPLAKGGLHEWDNVQLACFITNQPENPLPLGGGMNGVRYK